MKPLLVTVTGHRTNTLAHQLNHYKDEIRDAFIVVYEHENSDKTTKAEVESPYPQPLPRGEGVAELEVQTTREELKMDADAKKTALRMIPYGLYVLKIGRAHV